MRTLQKQNDRGQLVWVQIYMLLLLKFKVPISIFYYWHSDKRPKQIAFVTIRVDYCNNLFCGLPKYQLSKSQRVLNASARFINCAPKSCHITPLLRKLHWLACLLPYWVKWLLLTFKVLHVDKAPDYLRQLCVLPPSKYDLRRNHDSGILIASPKVRTKITLGDRSLICSAPRLWNLLHLRCSLFQV